MNQALNSAAPDTPVDRDWIKILQSYRHPNPKRSIVEIVVTLVPFAALWIAAWLALEVSYALTLLFAVPAALLLVRVFIIQHDCGHGAFFRKKRTNDWLGRLLGVLTMTPYDVWRRAHAIHHATSGNLDHRGVGDIDTLTVEEYLALPRWRRWMYRAYRHPLIMFVVGPSYIFLLDQRLPTGQMTDGWRPWASAMLTNLGIAAAAVLIAHFIGWKALLVVHLPIVVMAASVGVWLFYIQHQFEDTYWAEAHEWDQKEAALLGSSHYDLPPVMKWFSGNIGIHHVHHLYSKIPFYRLPEVLRDFPELADVRRVTFWESLPYAKLRLWDQRTKRLMPIAEVHALAR